MADKKISALTTVADADIGADDLLHIVDNPGGTPVNKKMTIGQLFQNIPTHLAIDSKEVLTAAAINLGSNGKFVTFINGSGFSGDVAFTLDNGSYVGQIKAIVYSGQTGGHDADITVTSWGYSTDTSEQIILDALGESVLLYWDNIKWYVLANNGATLS